MSEAVAALDIGTNSVRLLVTDAAGRELERDMRMTRLGQGVDVTGSLHPDAIRRTVAVLADYARRIAYHDAGRVRATATSAARDAANREAFFDAAEQALGVRPELLPGDEEARLSFKGATDGLDRAHGPFLVIDLGGGSTEFVLGVSAPEALISVKMGCVRMTERYFKSDPPEHRELEACYADVRRILEEVRHTIDPRRARTAIGLAGTVTAIAAFVLGLEHYDATKTHRARLTRAQIEQAFERLSTAPLAERRSLLIQPERAQVILGGGAVLVTILREFAIDELMVSETDILDGLAASLR